MLALQLQIYYLSTENKNMTFENAAKPSGLYSL